MIKKQLSVLIRLATIDNDLDNRELELITKIGKVNGLSDEEIHNLIGDPDELSNADTLSDDEKFEYLYNVVQLMKIDRQVFKTEIVFCQRLASKLGYKEGVIAKLSQRIYSDPNITADREDLKREAQKYLID